MTSTSEFCRARRNLNAVEWQFSRSGVKSTLMALALRHVGIPLRSFEKIITNQTGVSQSPANDLNSLDFCIIDAIDLRSAYLRPRAPPSTTGPPMPLDLVLRQGPDRRQRRPARHRHQRPARISPRSLRTSKSDARRHGARGTAGLSGLRGHPHPSRQVLHLRSLPL